MRGEYVHGLATGAHDRGHERDAVERLDEVGSLHIDGAQLGQSGAHLRRVEQTRAQAGVADEALDEELRDAVEPELRLVRPPAP